MASLQTIGGGKRPLRRLQFQLPTGERKTLRLGRMPLAQARTFKIRVEQLLTALRYNQPPDPEVVEWLAGLSDSAHRQLLSIGLVRGRDSTRLGDWLDHYLEKRSDVAPGTRRAMRQAKWRLLDYFDRSTPLRELTVHDARNWRRWLGEYRKQDGEPLAEATIRTACRFGKMFFKAAVEAQLIAANPFRVLSTGVIAADRGRYVTPPELEKLLGACNHLQYRLLIGLARLAGLRCPSETHALRWADIDWDNSRMIVPSPKTARHPGKECRTVPVDPRLMPILVEGFAAAEEGSTNVVTISTNNLHRGLVALIERAGLEPWSGPWQMLRRSRETEWAETYPQDAVSAWMGHSIQVSAAHYLQVPPELFEKASGRADKSDASRPLQVQNPTLPAHADTRLLSASLDASPLDDGIRRELAEGGGKATQSESRIQYPSVKSPSDHQKPPGQSELQRHPLSGGGARAEKSDDVLTIHNADPRLRSLILAWPILPEAVRIQMDRLIREAREQGGSPDGDTGGTQAAR